MKKTFLFLSVLVSLSSCKKDLSSTINVDKDNLLMHKVTYTYADTVKLKRSPNSKLKVNASRPDARYSVAYVGNSKYKFSVVTDPLNTYTWDIFRNGELYQTLGAQNPEFSVTTSLTAGTYVIKCTVSVNGEIFLLSSPPLTVVLQPIAPAGMLCLYEYYNAKNGQHVYTYDWEELGSSSNDNNFIKVLGYTYPSLSSAPNLKPIYRYYNAATGSHYTTDVLGTYPGFVYEKILGYVGVNATTDLPRSLTRYYNHLLDDHFVCVAPEVPQAPDYTPDPIFIFGYVQ